MHNWRGSRKQLERERNSGKAIISSSPTICQKSRRSGLNCFSQIIERKGCGAPGETRTRDPLLRSQLSNLIRTCRSDRKVRGESATCDKRRQTTYAFFITFKRWFCCDLSQLVLHFYDSENRGAKSRYRARDLFCPIWRLTDQPHGPNGVLRDRSASRVQGNHTFSNGITRRDCTFLNRS